MSAMSISINWHDDSHSIIVITIARDTTWGDYHQSIDWIVTEAAKVEHRIDIIFHDNVGMPRGNPMPHLSRGSTRIINQPNIHLTIIAGSQGTSNFIRMIMMALAKTFMRLPVNNNSGRTLQFIRTLEEALAYIQKDRAASSAV
jgi:hypothetical protein